MGMQVALWIGTVAVFSLAQAGMIMAWVMAGTVLRLAQEEVTGTKMFAYLRVLGLRKFLVWMTARGFRKQVRERCRQDWGPLKASAGVVLFAASFPAVASLVSLFFMSPFLLPGGEAAGLSARTVITAVALGIIPGAWFWMAGVSGLLSAHRTMINGSAPCASQLSRSVMAWLAPAGSGTAERRL
jgi:hypothetical protein